jgi:hypothetical protein
MTPPSHLAYVPFISVENMMRLIHSIGIETMLKELADAIEHDFTRWPLFDKTPRVGSHSEVGVIELMPTSDGDLYGFKYVNGHPIQHQAGPADGDRLRAAGAGLLGLSGAALGNDRSDSAEDSGDLGHGGTAPGAERVPG